MPGLKTFTTQEIKRFFHKWNLLAWFSIFILLFLGTHAGIDYLNSIPGRVKKFKTIRKIYFDRAPNYETIGRDGIKLLIIPGSCSAYCKNTPLPDDLSTEIDSIVKHSISDNLKGKSLVRGFFPGRLDFFLVLLLLLNPLALWWGIDFIRSLECYKYLSSVSGNKGIFYSLAVARFLVFALAFLFMNSLLYIYSRARGIIYTGSDHLGLISLMAASLVMFLIFFAVGAIIGNGGKKSASFLILFIPWFILTFLIPIGLATLSENSFPDSLEDYQMELDNFATAMEFEDYCKKLGGDFNRNNMEKEREFIEYYWNLYKNEIQARQKGYLEKLSRAIDKIGLLSMLFPTTFFMESLQEISSRGYLNLLVIYEEGMEMKAKFVRFYIDRTFYNDPEKIVRFIEDDEDIFVCRSRLPRYFLWGLALNFLYGAGLLAYSHKVLKRRIYHCTNRPGAFDKIKLELESHRNYPVRVSSEELMNRFLRLFTGTIPNPGWQITFDGKDISGGWKTRSLYLPDPAELPGDISIREFLRLHQSLLKLSGSQLEALKTGIEGIMGMGNLDRKLETVPVYDKARILLEIAGVIKPMVYILKDFGVNVPGEKHYELQCLLARWLEEKTVILDMFTDKGVWQSNPEPLISFGEKKGEYIIVRMNEERKSQ